MSVNSPPLDNRVDCKLRGVMRGAHHNRSAIGLPIINAVGNCHPLALGSKIMIINRRCFCAPNPARILEEPHQLLLLGVDTDNWKFFLGEELALPVDIIELAVAIRTVGTGEAFAIGVQSVAQLVEQIPDGIGRNANVHRLQLVADVLKTLAGPHPLSAHGVTGCAIAKELSQHAQDLRRFFWFVDDRLQPCESLPAALGR